MSFNRERVKDRTLELTEIKGRRGWTPQEKKEFEELNEQWFLHSARLIREEAELRKKKRQRPQRISQLVH